MNHHLNSRIMIQNNNFSENEYLNEKPGQLIVSKYYDKFKSKKEIINDYIIKNKSCMFHDIVGKTTTNPYPFLISNFQLNQYQLIQEALINSIKAIVNNYESDLRIKSTYNFSHDINEILDLYKNIPYTSVGSYR